MGDCTHADTWEDGACIRGCIALNFMAAGARWNSWNNRWNNCRVPMTCQCALCTRLEEKRTLGSCANCRAMFT